MDKSRNDEIDRFGHYRYYLLVETIPVRFSVDKQGGYYGAEWPGDTSGSLEPNPTLLSKYHRDTDEFTTIDEEEFNQRVRDYTPRGPVVSKYNTKL